METLEQNPILIDPEMTEIVDSFIVETKELLEKLDVDLVEMEKNPEDSELLNKIFRHFHTIKGTSSFLGLEKLTTVTHRCEDILNKLRKGEARLNPEIEDSILLAFDKIKSLLYCIESNKNEDVEVDETVLELTNLIATLENGGVKVEEPKSKKRSRKKKTSEEKEVPEVVEDKGSEQRKKEDRSVSENRVENESLKKTENSIRVDVERLDELLNIVSELVLGRNRLAQVNSEFALANEGSKYSRDLSDVTKQIDLMTNELQLVVMKTRMVKIGKVFNKFPRLVRDLSRETKKLVELVIKGEETELDKTLIEEINDPLVHLIRNCMDHGIEMPEDRKKSGKTETGTITLSAQHEGNNIIITIEDDGRGMDPEKLKQKAISKGMITESRANELSKQEALNLIFLPGFSTAEVVTNISGRGVGMDVVKTNVTKLRGIINIESNLQVGTKIIIKLPLTLAIIPGMIVKVKDTSIVIPLNSVLEVLRVQKNDIHSINRKPVIKMRDSVLPLVSVDELLFNNFEKNENLWQYVVIVGIAEKRFGIKVDSLVGQKEVVIKSLENYFGKVPGIAGSTIMGDGSVVMIVDINELLLRASN